MRLRFFFMLLMCGGATGCGWAEWPPPETGRRDADRPSAREVSSIDAASVIAGREDTVYILARRYGVSMRAIIDANNLMPPYRLTAGQRVILPREVRHMVVRGDTLSGLSVRYNVGMYELARANDLKPPFTIVVGKQLHIPGAGAETPAPAASLQAERSNPDGGFSDRIASSASPSRNDDETRVAPPEKSTAVTVAPLKEAPAAEYVAPVDPPTNVEPPSTAGLNMPLKSGKGFLWPVKGAVLSEFGPKAKGLHNDGINIAAPRGAPVMAAESGVVAYAGNEIRGFGFLLLIKHADDWVTAYAHNESLLVARGQKVSKGQIIAKVGSTGSVTKPQLHFEIRRGKRAVDPQAVETIRAENAGF